jgi:hypothetical protein
MQSETQGKANHKTFWRNACMEEHGIETGL